MKKAILVAVAILGMVSCEDDTVIIEKKAILTPQVYDTISNNSVRSVQNTVETNGQEDDVPNED